MSDHIAFQKDGAVAVLRFNRPEKKNALTVAMYAAMVDALAAAAADEDVAVLAILGGDGAFTAGNDIMDFMAAGGLTGDLPVIDFLNELAKFPKPIVAGVKGVAIGIGVTLLMHCDAIVVGRSARFSLPFTRLGIVPEAGSSLLFPLIAGRMRASWYLLSGEQFGADEARELGLATRVADDADVDGAVSIMCGQLAELPRGAVTTTKRLMKARLRELVEIAMKEEFEAFESALKSPEAQTAFMKFFQKG